MANLQYSSEILDYMLQRAGETTTGNSKFEARALIFLNRAYRSLADGGLEFDNRKIRDWWWLYTQSNIILQPAYTTGTVSVTQNSTGITLSATVATSRAGWYFKVDGWPDVFKVSAHTAGTAAMTLDSVYTGDTNATATYKLFDVEYDLPADFARLYAPLRAHQGGPHEVYSLSLREFNEQFPISQIQTGIPDRFTFMDSNTLRFNRYIAADDDYVRLDVPYMATVTDLTDSGSEEPLVPARYRHVLADLGTYFLMFDKEDPKTEGMLAQAKSGLKAMQNEQDARVARMGYPGRILPRGTRGQSRKLETSSGWARF